MRPSPRKSRQRSGGPPSPRVAATPPSQSPARPIVPAPPVVPVSLPRDVRITRPTRATVGRVTPCAPRTAPGLTKNRRLSWRSVVVLPPGDFCSQPTVSFCSFLSVGRRGAHGVAHPTTRCLALTVAESPCLPVPVYPGGCFRRGGGQAAPFVTVPENSV